MKYPKNLLLTEQEEASILVSVDKAIQVENCDEASTIEPETLGKVEIATLDYGAMHLLKTKLENRKLHRKLHNTPVNYTTINGENN